MEKRFAPKRLPREPKEVFVENREVSRVERNVKFTRVTESTRTRLVRAVDVEPSKFRYPPAKRMRTLGNEPSPSKEAARPRYDDWTELTTAEPTTAEPTKKSRDYVNPNFVAIFRKRGLGAEMGARSRKLPVSRPSMSTQFQMDDV